jgi:4'-phosphopantetheinyl transferase EntD
LLLSEDELSVNLSFVLHEHSQSDTVRNAVTAARRSIPSTPGGNGINWATLIFSAKESLYKAWFPLTHRWLDFSDAELAIDPRRRSFAARLQVPLPETLIHSGPFQGRFAVHGGLLVTSVVVPCIER